MYHENFQVNFNKKKTGSQEDNQILILGCPHSFIDVTGAGCHIGDQLVISKYLFIKSKIMSISNSNSILIATDYCYTICGNEYMRSIRFNYFKTTWFPHGDHQNVVT